MNIGSSYYPYIALVVNRSSSESALRDVIEKLEGAIVELYNGVHFSDYKRGWIQAAIEYFKIEEIELSRTVNPVWENISVAIIDNLVANAYEFQKKSKSVTGGSAIIRRSSNTGSSSSTTEASDTSVKQIKLSDEDKEDIKKEKMMEFALKQDYEHLCHSLIFHVQDSCWNDYFSPKEIAEIKAADAVTLPLLPASTKAYIQELEAIPKHALYETLNAVTHPMDSEQKWVQDTYNSCLRLVKSGYFPLRSDVTEQGISKRMWSFMDSCFDFSSVRCVSGEKCSKASADAANLNRPFTGSRQQCGRKMDYLFKTKNSDVEIGCGETVLVGGVNTTKEYQDAGFKIPKVLRDMMFKIVKRSPGLIHKLNMVGFYNADDTLTMWILDAPFGYVSRYYPFPSAVYPTIEPKIRSLLTRLLTLLLSAKIIMQNCQEIIDNDESVPSLVRDEPLLMQPCFVSSSLTGMSNKRRK